MVGMRMVGKGYSGQSVVEYNPALEIVKIVDIVVHLAMYPTTRTVTTGCRCHVWIHDE